MTIRSDPAAPAGVPANSVERALYGAARDRTRVSELLDELRHGRLWLPLPQHGPVTDGDALKLPTVRYLDAEFIPAFTSAGQLNEVLGRRDPDMAGRAGADPSRAPAVLGAQVPHAVVAAAELARLLPPGLGIALNPGAAVSVPVYPEDVAYLGEHGRRDRWLSDPRRPSAGGTHAAAQRHRGWLAPFAVRRVGYPGLADHRRWAGAGNRCDPGRPARRLCAESGSGDRAGCGGPRTAAVSCRRYVPR